MLTRIDIAEYILYVINLGVILGIIWYYNVTVREKYNSVYGFLFGGKTMSVLSISFALTASHLTSITLLGVPVEIYLRGTQYLASSSLSLIIVTCLTAIIYLPVFYRLQLTSSFEYLEIRFSAPIRLLAAVLFIISKLMILTIIPYVPLMAYKQVMNVMTAKITAVVCFICATLTAIAGLRAVVAMGIVTTILAIVGTTLPSTLAISELGFDRIWKIANDSGRLNFYDSDPKLFHHTSFFFVTLALTTNWLWKVALSQHSIQKLLAVNTIGKARLCLTLSCAGVIFMKLLSCLLGLVVYAWFEGWDPFTSKLIQKNEQLLPHFLDRLRVVYPGIYGIFAIAIFTATTGCIASTINSVTGVIFEEFIRPLMPKSTNELACCKIMKVICVVVGVYIALTICVSENLDRLQHVAASVTGIAAGTLLGLFTLGIVFTTSNCAGAISGCIVSLLVCSLLLISAQYSLATGPLTFEGKPLIAYGRRENNYHGTHPTSPPATLQPLFRIAFTYCPFLGALLVLLIGIPMSYFTGKSKSKFINPDVFCPLTQYFLPKSQTRLATSSQTSSEARSSVREASENFYIALKKFKQSDTK